MAPTRRWWAGSKSFRMPALAVAVALLVGEVLARGMMTDASARYDAAITAERLQLSLGALDGVAWNIAMAPSLPAGASAEIASDAETISRQLASLEHSDCSAKRVRTIAPQIRSYLASVERLRQDALAGDHAQLRSLAARQDRSFQAILPPVSALAVALAHGADGYAARVRWLAVALGLTIATVVVILLGWDERRRRVGVQRAAEAASRKKFEAMVERASDLTAITDRTGKVIYASPSARGVLGYDDAWAGTEHLDLLHPDDVALLRRVLRVAITSKCAQTTDLRIRHTDGSWHTIETTITDLSATPEVGGVLWNGRDVTERRQLEAELEKAAFEDPLTGLANRSLFGDRLTQAVWRAARSHRPVAVLLADLDGFKTINDSLGHGAGDQILVAVANRFRTCVRPGDTVARLGGDEFTVLLEDFSDHVAAEEVSARLLDVLHDPIIVNGTELHVTASIGISQTSGGEQSAEELLRDADVAMYSAKAEGRARSVCFDPIMRVAASQHLRLASDLTRALDRSEFAVHYQPIVSLRSLEVVGAEALLRWRHPERGLIAADAFIHLSERTGQIVRLGRWVLEQACRQAASWDQQFPASPHFTISVNLSGRQLLESRLVNDVRAVLELSGLDPEQVVLEIAEGILMQDVETMSARLLELHGLGVQLAIDDFGTGYSSLAYLRQFPVDILKVDRAFVESAGSGSEASDALLGAIVEMGSLLHLTTIAEGIEHASQADHLAALGCMLGQGFLFAPPLPADDFTRRLGGDPQPPADPSPAPDASRWVPSFQRSSTAVSRSHPSTDSEAGASANSAPA